MTLVFRTSYFALLGLLLLGNAAQAQTSELGSAGVSAPVAFAIRGYRVSGNTLLSSAQIDAATQAHTGAQASFETIQLALEALERAYLDAGYGSVRVEIPEQELDSGIVNLRVVEGVLGDISIEPNAYFDAENLRHALPALRLAETVNINALNRNLTLANESGSKVSNVTFKRNANNRDVDALVKVSADDPVRWLALLDNTGADSTGRYRGALVYQNANLLNRDHSLSLQAMSSPGHVGEVRIFGLSYRLPLYRLGDALDFNLSSSNVDSGQVKGAAGSPDLAISGSGLMLGLHYVHYFDAIGAFQRSVNVGLEHHAYGNNVTALGSPGSLVPDLSTHPFSVSYAHNWRSDQRDLMGSLTWLRNIPGGSHGSTADFNQSGGRSGADASFQSIKFSLQETERLPGQWQLHSAISGQQTSALLIAAEQFGVGGADSVRGVGDRGIAGDQGLRFSLELWSAPLNLDPWRMLGLVFLDAARVVRNQPAAGEAANQGVSSVGLGLRSAWGKHLSLRLDWGRILKGLDSSNGPNSGDQKLHASAAWLF